MPAREDIRTLDAPEDALGARVDSWLAKELPDLSRARIQGLIGQGKLTLDGALVKMASDKVRAGTYALVLPPPEPAAPLPQAIPLNIVFEDKHLLVINKQAGLAMHPAPGAMHSTLVNAVLHHAGASLSGIGGVARPGIVHRIDKDTTGLVVVAKSDVAHTGLAKQFAKHSIERAYMAVTRGSPREKSGIVDERLIRSREDRRKMSVVRDKGSEAGKHAITHYWIIESFGQASGESAGRAAAAFVECRLETGRTHQIRVHLASCGQAIAGDDKYGDFERNKSLARHGLKRMFLHAWRLQFNHPASQERVELHAALPGELEQFLAHPAHAASTPV